MAAIVVFHSALGLRPAIIRFAEALRRAGHDVRAPDLYQGAVFAELERGIAERDRIGIPELIARASEAVSDLPRDLFHVGFSMGAGPAQLLGATRPGTRGVVLVQGALPLAALGLDSWPVGLPLQLHTSPDDPWEDSSATESLIASVPADLVDHHRYPGCGHLFADDGLAEYDPAASTGLLHAVQAWLADRVPREPNAPLPR